MPDRMDDGIEHCCLKYHRVAFTVPFSTEGRSRKEDSVDAPSSLNSSYCWWSTYGRRERFGWVLFRVEVGGTDGSKIQWFHLIPSIPEYSSSCYEQTTFDVAFYWETDERKCFATRQCGKGAISYSRDHKSFRKLSEKTKWLDWSIYFRMPLSFSTRIIGSLKWRNHLELVLRSVREDHDRLTSSMIEMYLIYSSLDRSL